MTHLRLWLLIAIACCFTLWGLPTIADELSQQLAAGGRALESGLLDDAEQAFEKASQLQDSSHLPWLGLAEVAERRGRYLEGLRFARRSFDLVPETPADLRRPVLKSLVRLQIRLGAPGEALEGLETLRALDPADPYGYLTAALVMRDIDRPGEAVELLQKAVGAGIETPALVAQLGFLLMATQRQPMALDVARRGLTRYPDHPELELVVGLALAADPAKRSEAAGWLKKSLKHGAPDAGRVHLALGDLLADGSCQEEALVHYRQAAELRPQDPQVHYKLATGLRACGDTEGARRSIDSFRQLSQKFDAQDHQRKSVGAALNKIQGLASAGQLDEALSSLDALLVESPEDDRIWTLRAKVLFSKGEKEKALESASKARELMPSRVEAHYLEGLILSQMGKLTSAERALERARAIDGDRVEVLQLLGAVLAESERPEIAARHFEHALTIAPNTAVLRLAYSKLLARLGRDEESAEQMAHYRQLKGND